jgi:hypothetical protein
MAIATDRLHKSLLIYRATIQLRFVVHVFSLRIYIQSKIWKPALNGEEAVQITAKYAPRDPFSVPVVSKTSA